MLLERRFISRGNSASVTAEEKTAACRAGGRIAAEGRIGLVLGGGGAKGGYQIGCWKALRECGVANFDAIAGTSVGALNAVLVAQDEFDKAESIWREMSFGRVLRPHWYTVLALLIRVGLLPIYLGRLVFPSRAIPVGLWRATLGERSATEPPGHPRQYLLSALTLYENIVKGPSAVEYAVMAGMAIITVFKLSAWWTLGVPFFAILACGLVLPLAVMILVVWCAQAASALDFLSTRFVLATNEPLHNLLLDCVNIQSLQTRASPAFVTLASLREVKRTAKLPKRLEALVKWEPVDPAELAKLPQLPIWEPAKVSTVEYVPTHFDVSKSDPSLVLDLILQSAGLPEIFPARRWNGYNYVDGGIVDNEPVAALTQVEGLSRILVISLSPTNADKLERDLAANLERLGRSLPAKMAPLTLLSPSVPLGGFVFGTLGFRAARCQALMHLGYCDTVRTLAKMAS
jgi:predicted acylesterase/phospholipase RssA